MEENIIVQGRLVTPEDVAQISEMIAMYPQWSRTRLSKQLCHLWNWRNGKGVLKDIACRSLLRKLEGRGFITLPAKRRTPLPRMRQKHTLQLHLPFYSQASSLDEVRPLNIEIVKPGSTNGKVFATLLARHHYLGYRGSVGENIQSSLG